MRTLLLLIALALVGLPLARHAAAMPVEYSPPQHREPAWAESSEVMTTPGADGLESHLLSARAAASLTVSELRTRALAGGTGLRDHSGGPGPDAAGGRHGDATMVAGIQAFAYGDSSDSALDDVQIKARLEDVRENLAQVALWIANPEVGLDGKISYSVLGFSTQQSEGGTALMFRDLTLLSASQVDEGNGYSGKSSGRTERYSDQDPEARAAMLRMLLLAWDVLTHPVTIGLAILVVAFQLLVGLGARRAAF